MQMGYADGSTAFVESELEAARSSLIFEIIEEEKTVADVSKLSMLSYFRGIDLNYNKYVQYVLVTFLEHFVFIA